MGNFSSGFGLFAKPMEEMLCKSPIQEDMLDIIKQSKQNKKLTILPYSAKTEIMNNF